MNAKMNADNPFFRFMSLLGDLLLLSLVWLICSLPIVTAGASTLALFAVAHKLARKDKTCRILRDFFRAFRRDLKQATTLWLPLLLVAALLIFDFFYARDMAQPWNGLLTAGSVAGLLVWIAALGWGFALLSRFVYARGRDAIKNGLALTVRHPLATVVMFLLALWPAVVFALSPEVFLYLLPFLLLFGPGASALALAHAVRPTIAALEAERGFVEPTNTPDP